MGNLPPTHPEESVHRPMVIVYNAAISACGGEWLQALGVFNECLKRSLQPETWTFKYVFSPEFGAMQHFGLTCFYLYTSLYTSCLLEHADLGPPRTSSPTML